MNGIGLKFYDKNDVKFSIVSYSLHSMLAGYLPDGGLMMHLTHNDPSPNRNTLCFSAKYFSPLTITYGRPNIIYMIIIVSFSYIYLWHHIFLHCMIPKLRLSKGLQREQQESKESISFSIINKYHKN